MRIILLIAFCLRLLGCGGAPAPRPATFNHIVFFKLKDPAEAESLIKVCDERLGTIPGVVSYFCGSHFDIGRENVDSDYDVGFYVGFDTEEDYRAYLAHPDHVGVVKEWRPKFQWLRIYDVGDETK